MWRLVVEVPRSKSFKLPIYARFLQVVLHMLNFSIFVLQSEVADLESKVKSQTVSPSPYLIPDAPTLCTQLHVLKQLVTTKKFVIVVPIQGKSSDGLTFF